MIKTKIDPQNNKLLRHVFNIKEVQTNPEHIDMGIVSPVIDFSQGGFAKINNRDSVTGTFRSLSNTFTITSASLVSKTATILQTSDSTISSRIVVPIGYNFCAINAGMTCNIKSQAFLTAFGGTSIGGTNRRLIAELAMFYPNYGGTDYAIFTSRDIPIATYQSVYETPLICRPMWFPEGSTIQYILRCDNADWQLSAGMSWRTGGPLMDLPVFALDDGSSFSVSLSGYCVPKTVQIPTV